MEIKKYEIRDDGRIVALREGPWGPVGTVGGFVDSERNLSHHGNAWLFGDARVVNNARMLGDARAYGNTWVYGDARAYGNTYVVCGAKVGGGSIASGVITEHYVWAINDGYSKGICPIKGVAWIGAGCRWFTLADAIEHWKDREDRVTTFALLQGAIALADANGWKHK